MAKAYKIGEKTLTISAIAEIIASSTPLTLSQKSKQKIKNCRKYLDEKIAKSDEPIYGINTGVG